MGKAKSRNGKGKKKKSELQVNIELLDKLWRDAVLLRAGRQCEVCGRGGAYIQAHHSFPREIISTRYNVKNGVAMCRYHHILGAESAHRNPIWFTRWMEENRKDDLEELEALVKRQETKSDIAVDLLRFSLESQIEYLKTLKEK